MFLMQDLYYRVSGLFGVLPRTNFTQTPFGTYVMSNLGVEL